MITRLPFLGKVKAKKFTKHLPSEIVISSDYSVISSDYYLDLESKLGANPGNSPPYPMGDGGKNPLVIKYKDGLIILHLDIEDQLKKEGYVENNDHKTDDEQIQEDVVNDGAKDEEINEEIDADKTPQSQVNV